MAEQSNKQLLILEQENGKKIYLDLNVSTDTTAIESFKQSAILSERAFDKGVDISNSSFDYAAGIAVFLALCATWLAYWFGARSFKLTEMSFKAVSQDIKETAETNRMTTLSIIKSQEDLKNKELRAVFKNKWFDDVLKSLIEASNLLEVWITNARSINLLLIDNIINDPDYKIYEDKYCAEELKKLQDERREITFNLKKLRILLNLDDQTNDPQLMKSLLDIQINVNKISKALVQFEDCDAICRQLYLENVDISEHISNILKLKTL